jgi:hypothetical protein
MQATSVSTSTVSTNAESVQSTPTPENEFEFSDVTALMCFLCARQFKSLDQLKRHNKESDLHKARNLSVVSRLNHMKLTSLFVLSSPCSFLGKLHASIYTSGIYRKITRMPTCEKWLDRSFRPERLPTNPSIVTGL